MERRPLPGLDEVRSELNRQQEPAPPAEEDEQWAPVELEEPATWEDRRAPERAPGLIKRLGKLLSRTRG